MADKTQKAPKGMVKISHGDAEAWVVPSSVAAWERNGWTAEEQSAASTEDQPSATETTATSEADAKGASK